MKSVYKVTSQSIRSIIYTFDRNVQTDRYALNVSSGEKVINMRISNVTVDDGGLYLCGGSELSRTHYVYIFREIQLHVTGENLFL